METDTYQPIEILTKSKSDDGIYWVVCERFDSRLFWNEVLYSEGLHKPFFRGKIHLLALFVIAFYLYDHIQLLHNPLSLFVGGLNIFGNAFCFFVSGIYHTCCWDLQTEIFLQKLDHIAISLWCHFMMYPIAFLLLPTDYGYPFISINALLCLVNCVNIYHSNPSILTHSLVAGSLVPFLPICWYYMSNREWWFTICVFLFQIGGTLVFIIKKTPGFCNTNYFTFHEIFHILSIGSSIFIYLTNKEIIQNYIARLGLTLDNPPTDMICSL